MEENLSLGKSLTQMAIDHSIKVSVCMITYNHEKFISQAIESVLMQETTFPFEIVIGEDCSTDRTRNIVLEYQRKYPDKIRLLLPERNLGSRKNFVQTMFACQGQYLAYLEGDDYWTDPNKLQMQVEFLDNHPDCVICFHNVKVFYEDGSRLSHDYCSPDQKYISTIKDTLISHYIHVCSMMCRNGLISEFPDWFFQAYMGDTSLIVLIAEHGNIGYINQVMATHVKHPRGIWSGKNRLFRLHKGWELYDLFENNYDYKYKRYLRKGKVNLISKTVLDIDQRTTHINNLFQRIEKVLGFLDECENELPQIRKFRSQVLGKLYYYFLFWSFRANDPVGVRYCIIRLIRYDPTWLANRGVWSIGSEVFLGYRLTNRLRNNYHRFQKRFSLRSFTK